MTQEHLSPREVTVAQATEEDLRALVGIEEIISKQKYPNPELGVTEEDIEAIGWGEERMAKYRERFLDNPNAHVWVAKRDDRVIGFVAASRGGEGCWIRKLYIAGDEQRQGVGGQLLEQAEAWLGTDQDIQLGVASYDDAAKNFYLQHGYEEVGERPTEETTIPATGAIVPETILVKRF